MPPKKQAKRFPHPIKTAFPADLPVRKLTEELEPYAQNSRLHSPDQVKQIMASIEKWGFTVPVLIDENDGIIAGHGRVLAAKKLGMKEVPCIVASGWSEADKKAYIIADNKLAENAEWDEEMLALEFGSLRDEGFDIGLTGFEQSDIDDILDIDASEDDADEVIPIDSVAVTALGETWLLGDHRLRCGDSTDMAQVKNLIGEKKIELCFTDPPYGIDVVRGGKVGGDKPFGKGKNGFNGVIKANDYAPIIGDDSIATALKGYEVCQALGIKTIILWGGNFYAHKLPPAKCWIVWDKETDGNFGDGEIAWCNADKSIRIFRHKWSGMLKASEKKEKRCHPTQKPVALATWAFEEFGKSVTTVLDLFLGSGSTLIACEQSKRVCYGLELSPLYCDVIIKRWMNFTGKSATLEGTGKTFEEISVERTKKQRRPAATRTDTGNAKARL